MGLGNVAENNIPPPCPLVRQQDDCPTQRMSRDRKATTSVHTTLTPTTVHPVAVSPPHTTPSAIYTMALALLRDPSIALELSPCFTTVGSQSSLYVCSSYSDTQKAILKITPQYPVAPTTVIGGCGNGVIRFTTTQSDATGPSVDVTSFSILTSNTNDGRLPIGSILLDKLIAGSHDGVTVVAWSPPIYNPGAAPLFQTYINPTPAGYQYTGYMNDTLLNPAAGLASTVFTTYLQSVPAPNATLFHQNGYPVAAFTLGNFQGVTSGLRTVTCLGGLGYNDFASAVATGGVAIESSQQSWYFAICATNVAMPTRVGTGGGRMFLQPIPSGATILVPAIISKSLAVSPQQCGLNMPHSGPISVAGYAYLQVFITNNIGFAGSPTSATDWTYLTMNLGATCSVVSLNALPKVSPDSANIFVG